jgi:hypothetical protein
MYRVLTFVVLLAFEVKAQVAPSNEPPPEVAAAASPRTADASLLDFFSARTPYEFWLTVLIGFLGVLNAALVLWAYRSSMVENGERVLRYMAVIAILTATLILITAGYSNQQVAPAFGLFGTIVGYLLGRQTQPTPGTDEPRGGEPPGPAKPRPQSQSTQRSGPATRGDGIVEAGWPSVSWS